MKLRVLGGFIPLTLMLFWGCATTYGPKKLAGGYSEQMIDDVTVQVTFEGNQYSDIDEIRTYLTYRCSEVTLAQGFSHFMIIEDNSFKHLGSDEIEDQGLSFETTTSMSGGVNTRVSSGFEKKPTTNLTGSFTIQMMPDVHPVYPAASIEARVLLRVMSI